METAYQQFLKTVSLVRYVIGIISVAVFLYQSFSHASSTETWPTTVTNVSVDHQHWINFRVFFADSNRFQMNFLYFLWDTNNFQ